MKLPYIEASGSHYEIGHAIGSAMSKQIRAVLKRSTAELAKHPGWDPRPFLARTEGLIRRYFPGYLDELQGMADGASQSLQNLVLLSSDEAVSAHLKEHCTTVGMSSKECILLGHNEDWTPGFGKFLYIIRAEPKGGAAFLSLAYAGCPAGSSVALNSHGIAFSGNSLLSGVQEGVPKNIILRSQIEAATLRDFVRRAKFSPHAIPNHSLAVDVSGRMVSVEVLLDRHRAVYGKGALCHTNHCIHPGMVSISDKPRPSSLIRYGEATRLLDGGARTKATVRRILRCHEHYPLSVCRHARKGIPDETQTIASVIVDLKEKTMEIAAGNPCKSRYVTYAL